MISKEIAQYPIIYSGSVPFARYGIGWGVHQTVADECKKAGIKKALIVTTGLKGTGIVEEIKSILEYNGVPAEIFDKVTSNPKDHEVMAGYKVFKAAECDGVVSVGGGSAHDCSKGIRAVACNNGRDISELYLVFAPGWIEAMQKLKPVTIPQVCVNTTAGTCADLTGGTWLTDTKNRMKQCCILPGITPSIGLTDPLLVRLMPKKIAAWTGLDAFAHAYEGCVSSIQAFHGISIALGAIELIAENLREFSYNRMNHVACENMCWAQSMAGYGLFFGGGTGIVHGVGQPIGAVTDGHHGRIMAALALPGERLNEAARTERFAQLARAMGVDTRGMSKMQAADKWFDEVERLLKDLNVETGNLTEQVGLQEKDFEHIIKQYFDTGGFGNAADLSHDEVYNLLKGVL